MSRKVNNLRKRLRIQQEREAGIAKRESELRGRELRAIGMEANAREAKRELERTAAATITVDAPAHLSRDLMELRVQIDPRRIHFAALYGQRSGRNGGMSDVGFEFHCIARDVENKVYEALMDYAQKDGKARAV